MLVSSTRHWDCFQRPHGASVEFLGLRTMVHIAAASMVETGFNVSRCCEGGIKTTDGASVFFVLWQEVELLLETESEPRLLF